MALMVSVSGIRGIIGTDFNPVNISSFAAAFGTWTKGGKVVIGRDSRVTGEMVEQIVAHTLTAVGCDVILLGIVPTPTVAMAVLNHNADAGIIISASHNPAQWNALKLLNNKSEFLDADQGKEVIALAENQSFQFVSYDKIGKIRSDSSSVDYHIEKILELSYINKDIISKANLSVSLDAVNGAGSESIPALLEALGVKNIHKLHCSPNGLFPHNPEPLPEHLTEICSFTKENDVDLGIVVDPDADRLAFIDNNGRFFGEEYTLAAINDFYLAKNKGNIVTNLSSSMINEWIAEKYEVKCERSAVGEINVVKKMQAINAVMGGEGNGGVINPDLHYGRDALVGIAMMLQFMAETKESSSEIRDRYPTFYMGKFKMSLDSIDGDEALAKAKKQFSEHEISTIDGLKINFENSWVHLRKSNTEPIIRIYTEAQSAEKAEQLATEIKDIVKG